MSEGSVLPRGIPGAIMGHGAGALGSLLIFVVALMFGHPVGATDGGDLPRLEIPGVPSGATWIAQADSGEPSSFEDLFGVDQEPAEEAAPAQPPPTSEPGAAAEQPVAEPPAEEEPEMAAPAEEPTTGEPPTAQAPTETGAPTAPGEAASGETPAGAEEPATTEELFGVEPEAPQEGLPTAAAETPSGADRFFGFFDSELAFAYLDPNHWTNFRNVLQIGTRGQFDGGISWLASLRLAGDLVYVFSDFYPEDVNEEQRFDGYVWETYADISRGNFDFRIGRQHIVWGEVVALFFADVVSPRDLRQFILPDFDMQRIPQWAFRGEYFSGPWHAEAIWLPYMTYDDIGRQGAEFFPFRPPPIPGFETVIHNDDRPDDGLSDTGYGVRANYLSETGWDSSAFFFSSPSLSPAFERSVTLGANPQVVFSPEHQRNHRVGGTTAKDLGFAVFKGELVYTPDALWETENLADADGVVEQEMLDYIAALDFSLERDSRVSLQAFQRRFLNHDSGIVPNNVESGYSILVATRAFHPDVEPEILWIQNFNHSDWLFQFRVTWDVHEDWSWVNGVDVFNGPELGFFGRFDHQDRVYSEVRYSF